MYPFSFLKRYYCILSSSSFLNAKSLLKTKLCFMSLLGPRYFPGIKFLYMLLITLEFKYVLPNLLSIDNFRYYVYNNSCQMHVHFSTWKMIAYLDKLCGNAATYFISIKVYKVIKHVFLMKISCFWDLKTSQGKDR